ncbi:hypothetical protein ACFX19_042367 [Malus domestica]
MALKTNGLVKLSGHNPSSLSRRKSSTALLKLPFAKRLDHYNVNEKERILDETEDFLGLIHVSEGRVGAENHELVDGGSLLVAGGGEGDWFVKVQAF